MSHPDLVQTHLGDESVAAQVALGGEDELFVTPTRTLIYRADGLLSDESVEEYTHDAERISVAEGRRKSKVTLDYGLDGEATFAVPTKRLDEALHPVIAGVLNAAGITDAGESVTQTYRFSELTLVITSARVVKHIGNAVWDGDYEEFHYEDIVDLDFEDGSVATSVVITTGDRQERFKTPNEQARAVREGLTDALCSFYDVGSLEEFRVTVAPEDEGTEPARDTVDFGEGPAPLSANPGELSQEPANATRSASNAESREATTDAPATVAETLRRESDPTDSAESTGSSGSSGSSDEAGNAASTTRNAAPDATTNAETRTRAANDAEHRFAESGFEPAVENDAGASGGEDAAIAEELAALREAVERQNDQLRAQQETIQTLIEELRRGR